MHKVLFFKFRGHLFKGSILINKGGKFLKKLWCCVGGNVTRLCGFINWVDNVN